MSKPDDWNAMSKEQQYRYALLLLRSSRGQLIMAQVMEHGIKAMKAVPAPYTELSNIEDLEIIRERIFNFPVFTHEDMEELRKQAEIAFAQAKLQKVV